MHSIMPYLCTVISISCMHCTDTKDRRIGGSCTWCHDIKTKNWRRSSSLATSPEDKNVNGKHKSWTTLLSTYNSHE